LFPGDFLWGAATSAYQIEGSPLADGAGPSNWHRFTHTPGHIRDGNTGDVACDHYRLWRSDVELMKALGLQAYRFSLSWSRILPEGRGRVNPAGLDFYSALVDALLEQGIQPLPTLFHWDLPAALEDRGGWLNRDIAGWFADYSQVVFEKLRDRVGMWSTLNEPWVVADGGYLFGTNAPGHRDLFETPLASHHMLLAHGRAVEAFRAGGGGKIGLVVNLEPKEPASASQDDREATERAEIYMNRQYLDPVMLGRHAEGLAEIFGEAWPENPAEDLKIISQPLDLLGINYYTRGVTRFDPSRMPTRSATVRIEGSEYTETGWEVAPEAFTRCLLWVRERYGNIPLYITENGIALPDPPAAVNGRVNDPRRIAYLRSHLLAVAEARRQGVDVRGYFAWSLLDNFEWGSGFSKRFGIVHVDYATQARTIKDSGEFYREVIRSNGDVLAKAD
jgi:beta-glucosidase